MACLPLYIPYLLYLFAIYPCFHKGLDCILSRFRLTRPSLPTNTRSVVETLPYPVKTDLGSKPADYPSPASENP